MATVALKPASSASKSILLRAIELHRTTAEGGFPRGDEPSKFSWTLTLGDLGSVRGWARNEPEALATMRSTADAVAGSRFFGPIVYDLGTSERVEDPGWPDAVVTRCYRVETDDATEIDTLPAKLAEQRASVSSQIDHTVR